MNEKTYRVLEFNKITELLAGEASSQMAKKIISELKTVGQPYLISDMLTETTEAVSVIMNKGPLPLGTMYDTKRSVRYAEKGGTLTMKQLLEIRYNLRVARDVVTFMKSDLPKTPILSGMIEVLTVLKRLETRIEESILSEEEMADSASPQLRDIRRSIARQKETVRARMNSILSTSSSKGLLQDDIITMRDGRFVIPVKQEHKSKFPGIVHDQSSTGATLFVEPQVIVNLNNELREMEIKEQVEIQRILDELSREVAAEVRHLINNQNMLVKLEVIFAKGKLSVKMNGTPAILNEKGHINIKNGRHPLIDREKVVPISVSIGEFYRTLVITGPNTGGKTVTLKTVGLLMLMNQAGLHVPADDGTELPVMKKIYADIGDEQSIEQSLSTFSSHMNNIVEIVHEADEDTFVLVDELGAGTDPTEGAALAIAILNYLYQKGSLTMATTHYNELKKYAIATSGVENASMEFNVETLSPTYRLTVGTPGRSNAFEIARKLGLKEEIVERARGLLGREDVRFEEILASIEKDRQAAEEERVQALQLKLKLQKEYAELEKRKEKLDDQRKRALDRAREEASAIVQEAKTISDEIKFELQQLRQESRKTLTADMENRHQDIRRRLKKTGEQYKDTFVPAVNASPAKREELKLGDEVKVVSFGQRGSVVTLPDERDELMVQIGPIKVNVKLADVTKIHQQKNRKRTDRQSNYGSMYRHKTSNISSSINVIGKNLEDAMMEVDKYLDDAYIAGLQQVTIIHGRGEGILRDGLHQLFRKHGCVEHFQKGGYYEGGDGVTIVSLKTS